MTIKKTLSLAAAAMLTVSSATAEIVTMHTPESFQILGMSPNGKWACGVYVDAAQNAYGFRWNLEGGTIEMLGNTTATAWDVANDGTVSGDFIDSNALPNGAPTEMPGYWRDGAWHTLEMPSGTLLDGIGYGISPDGHYMTGAVCVDGKYRSYIWNEGRLHRSLAADNHAVSFAVSPDGNAASGFITTKNRTACYWQPDGNAILFTDSPDYSYGPWSYGRNFSPDGTKLLYWGGWEIDADNNVFLYSVYDIATGERIKIKAPSYESDVEFFDISNSGMLVGSDGGRGYMVVDGVGMYIDDYLAMRGVDLSDFEDFYGGTEAYTNSLPIFRVETVSEDENTFALLYYNTEGQIASMILKIDQDPSKAAPAEVAARQLEGLSAVALSWKRPAGINTVRGYNVYRDGKKINGLLPLTSYTYYDRNLASGTYTYEVTALHFDGSENRAEAITVTVEPQTPAQPYGLFARQKGVNSVFLSWDTPMTNIMHKRYFQPEETNMSDFAVYDPCTVEMAVKYDKAEMAAYAGGKLSEVSFIPQSVQGAWRVKLYSADTDGSLTELCAQEVTQPLTLRAINTVHLDTPLDIPAADLVVAVEVDVVNVMEPLIDGVGGRSLPGYTDLLRRDSDGNFFSAYESSTASGMSVSSLTWGIDLGITPADTAADALTLTGYTIYQDGAPVGECEASPYELPAVADGDHTFGVQAHYADAATSLPVETPLSVRGQYAAISKVDIDPGEEGSTLVTATWQAPIDRDVKRITYSTAQTYSMGIKGTSGNSYALMAGCIYPASRLRGYAGYRVESFRFYPLADALFTFLLYKEDELVCELEVNDYTVGKWNEVAVPEDIYIEDLAEYRLVLDCFDPVPNVPLVAIDSDMAFPFQSDLYSIDNGESWSSISGDTGARGNWMLSMDLANPSPEAVPVDGYDVEVDGVVRNETRLTAPEFAYDFGTRDDKRHSMRVSVYYQARSEAVRGQATYFYMAAAGIADNMIANIVLHRGDNWLVAEGEDVEHLTVYSAAGTEVAAAAGDRVDISALSSGVYVVRIQSAGTTVTRKINILK